jgi:hypothetical protein
MKFRLLAALGATIYGYERPLDFFECVVLIIKGQPDSRYLRTDSFTGRGWRHCLISTACFAHHEAACRGVLYASHDCIGNHFLVFGRGIFKRKARCESLEH